MKELFNAYIKELNGWIDSGFVGSKWFVSDDTVFNPEIPMCEQWAIVFDEYADICRNFENYASALGFDANAAYQFAQSIIDFKKFPNAPYIPGTIRTAFDNIHLLAFIQNWKPLK